MLRTIRSSIGVVLTAMILGLPFSTRSSYAVDECGPDVPGVNILACLNPAYPNGIVYLSSDGATIVINNPAATIDNSPLPANVALSSNAVTANTVSVIAQQFSTITVTGDVRYGIIAQNIGLGGAYVQLDDGTITTSGLFGLGLYSLIFNSPANPATAEVEINGGTIQTTGQFGFGALANNRGLGQTIVTMNGGTINTTGEGGIGLYSLINEATNASAASANMLGGSITTTGDGAFGVYAQTDGTGSVFVDFSDGQVQTGGAGAHGFGAVITNAASAETTTITMSGGSVATSGAGAHGLFAQNQGAGNVAITSASTVSASGPGSDGIRAEAPGGGTFDVDVIASTVTGGSGSGAGIHTIGAGGGTIDISSGAVVDGRNGQAGIVDEDGPVTVSNFGSVLNGMSLGAGDDVVSLNAGSLTTGDLSLGDGSDNLRVLNGANILGITAFDGGDDVGTADGFIDTLTFSNVTASLNGATITNWENVIVDGGTMSFGPALTVGSGPGTGLSLINGAILNTSGGFALGGNLTNLGTVTSQNGVAGDAVRVSGNYAGGGRLHVDADFGSNTADTLSVGGSVTAPGTTIAVTDASRSAANGQRVLLVDVAGVTASGDFVLEDGSIMAGAFTYDLELIGSQWFLISDLNAVGAVYEATPSALINGFARLPTLEQRVGQRTWVSNGNQTEQLQPDNGIWLRVSGDRLDGAAKASNTGYKYNNQSWNAQAGVDFRLNENGNGVWVLGVTGQYGKLGTDIYSDFGSGAIDADGVGIGATATWYADVGTYVDVQAQVNWIESKIATSTDGVLADDQRSRMTAVSIEAGQKFWINQNVSLIPQAQIMFSQLDGGRFVDTLGNTIDLTKNTSATGRIGLAIAHERTVGVPSENNGYREKVYAIGNILRDFSSATDVNVDGLTLSADQGSTWAEFGAGGSIVWDEKTTLYAEGSYRVALDGKSDAEGVNLTAGVRVRW